MSAEFSDSSAISLYFDCAHDEGVSLEVIARSALAWDGLIKELAAVADPSIQVRVDFLSGTIGSRSINSIIRTAGRVALKHPWTAGSLGALTGVFLLSGPTHVADDVTSYLAKEWFGHEHDALTDNDVERIAKRVVELQRDRDAMRLKQDIYRAADADPRIKAIGSAPRIGRPPDQLIVPRSDFEIHNPIDAVSEPVETRTTYRSNERVAIVRPYSKGEERRWRFENERGEFSATMRDPIFLEALRTRHTGIEIGEGVEMWVDLRVKEDLIGEEWVEREIDVLRVVKPNVDLQSSFHLTPNQPDKPDSK